VDVGSLKEKWTGWEFDEVDFEIDAEQLVEFSAACGETLPKFLDPANPDFQAPPSFCAKFHGERQLPDGFPMERSKSFDGGKSVEHLGLIRPGDTIKAKSSIHNIFEKTGRSGGMMFVVHRMRFFNQRSELVSVVDWQMIQKLG
jgi:hypothetical protein